MELSETKNENWQLPKFLKLFYRIILISNILVPAFVVYYGSIPYRRIYYPEISPSEFLPIRYIASIGAGVLVRVPSLLVLSGIARIYLRLTQNKGPFSGRDWFMLINVSSTLIMTFVAYACSEVYFSYRPMPHFKQVVFQFFVCALTAFIVCAGGGVLLESTSKTLRGNVK